MPDAIDVINGLECIISSGNAGMRDDCASCIYPGSADCLAPALRDALAMLKAQEPVEPVFERQFMTSIEIYDCGKCGTSLGAKGIAKYCMKCGQAVKWK